MCGIISVFDQSKKLSENDIQKLTETLSHRGPDDGGYKIYKLDKNNVGLGHRRLSILDLSVEGHQPMSFKDYEIVFNGEIYNFLDIREKLEEIGYHFISNTDTEVFLKAFEAWGKSCFSMLNGMFAAAIYSYKTNELIICRDKYGIKPLYYIKKNKLIAFASEITPLKFFLKGKTALNSSNLTEYLKYRFIEGNSTFISDIYEFPKSEIWSVSENLISKEKIDNYSSNILLKKKKITGKETELNNNEILENLLIDSIEKQIYADVPVGFFLSGGLDSSLLVSIASKVFDQKFDTYSVSFQDYEYSEKYYQELVVKDCGTNHHNFVSTHENYFSDYVYSQSKASSPHIIPNYTQIYQLAKVAKNKVKVLLSGEGADEIFGGYGRFLIARRMQLIKKIKIKKIIKVLALINPKFSQYIPEGTPSEHYIKCMTYLTDEEINNTLKLTTPIKCRKIQNEDLNNILEYDQSVYMRGLLNRADSMSMLAGIEVRVPYVDPEIIEFANKLSFNNKVSLFQTKRLLAKVAKKYVPHEIINRSKIGFPIPLSQWMCQNQGMGKLKYILCDDRSKERNIYNIDVLNTIFKNPSMVERYAQNLIFPLLSHELWIRTFIEGTPYEEFSFKD